MTTQFFSYSPTPEQVDRNTAILRNLSDEDWDKVLSFGALRRYPAGHVICGPGSEQKALYFVVSGVVQAEATAGAPAATFTEGNVFGILSFLDGEPNAQTTVAQDEVEVMMLTPEAFEQMAAWHPRIGIMLLRDLGADLAQRLRRLDASA